MDLQSLLLDLKPQICSRLAHERLATSKRLLPDRAGSLLEIPRWNDHKRRYRGGIFSLMDIRQLSQRAAVRNDIAITQQANAAASGN